MLFMLGRSGMSKPDTRKCSANCDDRGSSSRTIGFGSYMTAPSKSKKNETLTEHDEATVNAFVIRDKRERFLSFATNPKKRDKFVRELAHFRWFDPRFATPVPWKPDPKLPLWERHLDGIRRIEQLLKSKGAGNTCWVTSEDANLDGKVLELDAALEAVVGRGMGTILSFIPGRLAYYEGEDDSLLLAR